MGIVQTLIYKEYNCKKYLLGALFLIGFFSAKAQDYYHSAGANGFYAIQTYSYYLPSTGLSNSGAEVETVFGAYYKAIYAFDLNNDNNLAISAAPSLGLNLSSSLFKFGVDFPILSEYYFGDIYSQCIYLQWGFSFTYIAGAQFFRFISGPRFGVGKQFSLEDDYLYNLNLSLVYAVNKNRYLSKSWENGRDSRYILNLSVGYILK